MSFEDTIRKIIREENERHLEEIRKLLQSYGVQEQAKLLKVDEAAKILKMGKSSVYELARHSDFPAIRDGRKVRIPYTALMQWIEKKSSTVS
ncbi:helix-turn-helix domain-containing protein [Bacillus sp. FSL W8-0223]|uniref:helix-turn-helix domain-containing protein n=1 Tax=Bacillus sp. FSL W8-0223 TaxID=2954595 RepID=UPI0030F6D1FB